MGSPLDDFDLAALVNNITDSLGVDTPPVSSSPTAGFTLHKATMGRAPVLVKVFSGVPQGSLTPSESRKVSKAFLSELGSWKFQFSSKSFVNIIGYSEYVDSILPSPVYEQTELAKRHLKEQKDVDLLGFIQKIIEGVEIIHRNNVAHGDLRADNILVDSFGFPRICDHGLTRIICLLDKHKLRGKTDVEPAMRWMPPEYLHLDDDAPFILSKQGDIWSLGMTIFELWSGNMPYYGTPVDRVAGKIRRGESPIFPKVLLPGLESLREAVSFLCGLCWKSNPADRRTAPELTHITQELRKGNGIPSIIKEYEMGNKRMPFTSKEGSTTNSSTFASSGPRTFEVQSFKSPSDGYDSGYNTTSEPDPSRRNEVKTEPSEVETSVSGWSHSGLPQGWPTNVPAPPQAVRGIEPVHQAKPDQQMGSSTQTPFSAFPPPPSPDSPLGSINSWMTALLNCKAKHKLSSLDIKRKSSGEDHQPTFTTICRIDGKEYARCTDAKRKGADEKAARDALTKLYEENPSLAIESTPSYLSVFKSYLAEHDLTDRIEMSTSPFFRAIRSRRYFKWTHYWKQIQAALIAGHWNSSCPGKTPNGTLLPWSELFRKAKKHSKHSDVPEAALQTYFLSLLLSTTKAAARDVEEKSQVDGDGFGLGDECVLLEERCEDALKVYEDLQQLNSSDEYVRQALAYFAYALNRPSECLEYVSGVAFGEQLLSSNPSIFVTSEDEKIERLSQRSSHSAPVEVSDDSVWVFMEALRSMAHERISPGSPSQALASYDKGVHLLQAFSVPKSPPPRAGRASFESFNKYTELWRWTERLLWRSVILSAQHRSIESIMPLFQTYTFHSVHWPPSFQPDHRSTILTFYLRALILLSSQSNQYQAKAAWTHEMRNVVHEYRAVLGASTHFPTAGEHNVLVEEFVDYCVAGWEAGGAVSEQASWVIDVLWWATRLTFNSPRVLRHMFRLLHVSGDNELAKRVLRLYVQIVRKARETGTMNDQGEDTHDTSTTELDVRWVQTLTQGARMLCRIPGGVKEAREAAELVAYARDRVANLSDELVASVDLADGICIAVLAIREQEPTTRGPLLSISVDLLLRAVERNTTPSACFHAAIALSRPIPERNLQKAVELCRRAVEAEPKDVRFWHLLALLAAKQGEWKKAEGVLQAALEIVEDVEFRSQEEEITRNGVVSRDFAATNGHQTPTSTIPYPEGNGINGSAVRTDSLPGTLIDPDARSLPPAASLLQPIPDHPPPTRRQLFEHVLQLRMTQIAIAELVEGPESVEACWLEVFEWYSQRRDTIPQVGSTRPSSDARRTPTPAYAESAARGSLQAPSEVAEGSSLSVSNNQSTASTSVETVTVRSPIRSSADRATEVVQSGRRSKERNSTESQNSDRDKKGKRVQRMLKNQVHKQQARMHTISRKIGHGVVKGSMNLYRSNSAPDLHSMLVHAGPYQASSIHSRRRISFSSRVPRSERGREAYSPPPSPPPPALLPTTTQESSHSIGNARERRLLSDLWLMSAATFRRLEKIDQTRGAIQEAETLDEENEAVWVQLGLYFSAQGEESKAIEAFQKALFISQDDVPATIHLCNLYLTSRSPLIRSDSYGAVDIAVGMLEAVTRGSGWDVAETWYLLAKAYNIQGRKDRERECLMFALGLAEVRGVRDIGTAIGWSL
ncbi:hypothetical protein ACEPAF_1962 [Sanghuangporus sanghuang]